MKKIAIVTDSNSGITQEMGKSMGIYVIPMPFFIDGELFQTVGRQFGYFHVSAISG